ncbi:MAG TPA: hypothetical protein VEO01_26935 [Pseudonocardiaceae bacterium]|nr:hypothetical protein [Pseudonocardiaceae bacterium]
MRSPWVLAQATLAYLLVGVLTGSRLSARWRWSATAALVLGTAAVIASGYRFS